MNTLKVHIQSKRGLTLSEQEEIADKFTCQKIYWSNDGLYYYIWPFEWRNGRVCSLHIEDGWAEASIEVSFPDDKDDHELAHHYVVTIDRDTWLPVREASNVV